MSCCCHSDLFQPYPQFYSSNHLLRMYCTFTMTNTMTIELDWCGLYKVLSEWISSQTVNYPYDINDFEQWRKTSSEIWEVCKIRCWQYLKCNESNIILVTCIEIINVFPLSRLLTHHPPTWTTAKVPSLIHRTLNDQGPPPPPPGRVCSGPIFCLHTWRISLTGSAI